MSQMSSQPPSATDDQAAGGAIGADAVPDLSAYRDDPFRLLLEMQRRAREARIGQGDEAAHGREWSGVAVRVGDLQLLAPRADVAEVMMPPQLTRVPGAQPWLRGLAQLRGQLLPLTDLRAFLLDEPPAALSAARVLVPSHHQIPTGLVVDEVYGFRQFTESQRRDIAPATLPGRVGDYVDTGFQLDEEVWPVLQLRELIESERFLDPAV
jgi:twitching motility protein PilI